MKISEVLDRNEATIQAEIYRLLKNDSINCYLEIKIKNPYRKLNSIVDIVICDSDDNIIYFIEVKARDRDKAVKTSKAKAPQKLRYKEISEYYDIPFLYCYGKDEIAQTVKTIKSCF